MDDTLSYGLGAGTGVVEYYMLKRLFPAAPNLAAGLLGAGALVAKYMGVVPSEYSDLLVANGFTLVAIAGVNAVTNPQSTMVRVY